MIQSRLNFLNLSLSKSTIDFLISIGCRDVSGNIIYSSIDKFSLEKQDRNLGFLTIFDTSPIPDRQSIKNGHLMPIYSRISNGLEHEDHLKIKNLVEECNALVTLERPTLLMLAIGNSSVPPHFHELTDRKCLNTETFIFKLSGDRQEIIFKQNGESLTLRSNCVLNFDGAKEHSLENLDSNHYLYLIYEER
jgi:hypothetical protein